MARLLNGWQQAGEGPVHERLATVLGSLLLDGRLAVDIQVPSERDLAAQLRVSRGTVAAAYARLREDGFLASRPGAGNWTVLPRRCNRSTTPLGPAVSPSPGLLDLAVAVAPPAQQAVTTAFAEAVRALDTAMLDSGTSHGHGYYPVGIQALRTVVADRYAQRGAPTTPEQILITAGAQGAIHILSRLLLRSGDLVMVEQPTYPNAVDAFRRSRARLISVPVTQCSWDMTHVSEMLTGARPRLAYLILDFHNPTGAVLSEDYREELTATAQRSSTVIVVDETQAELALDCLSMPRPLSAFGSDDRVISVGSLSKVFWGGLRVGWIRAAPALIAQMALDRSSIDLASPVVEQLAAVYLLNHLGHLLPERLRDLAHRRETLLTALATYSPHWTWTRPPGGLSVWVRLDRPISTALADAAERYSVRIPPGPRFGLDGAMEQFLRIPYSLPTNDLERAVARLYAAERDVVSAIEKRHGRQSA